MSARFGRNKRRAAREQIAALSGELGNMQQAYRMADGLCRRQGQKIAQLTDEIDEAKEIAGRMSILFPATTIKSDLPSNNRDFLNLPITGALPRVVSDLDYPVLMMSQRLSVMLGNISRDALDNSVHVNVTFGDKKWGYSISDSGIKSMPAGKIVDRVARSFSDLIGRDLFAALS